MNIAVLNHRLWFPDPHHAPADFPLAIGGDLRPERLELAYRSGIFPWYNPGEPILWHSPDPRFVLQGADLIINRSLRKRIHKADFEIRLDTAFSDVIHASSKVPRNGRYGTWITKDMKRAYIELHRRGLAHSAEAWRDGQLVGGLYGVSLGSIFFGESMFALEPDASKIAFVALVQQLLRWNIPLVDCQAHTEHLERFGANLWPRQQFLQALKEALLSPTRQGSWSFDPDFSLSPTMPQPNPDNA